MHANKFAGSGIKNENISSKVILFLLCVIDISSKWAWVIPLKDKKGITINNDFQKILDEINYKQNKIWVDKGSWFYDLKKML